MRKIFRTAKPLFLTSEKEEEWGERYKKNREEKGISFEFQWPKVEKVKLNQKLLPTLRQISQNHCFYCDAFPTEIIGESIDHFKPKGNPLFYVDVCKWENLYLACKHCQDSKKEDYNELLLRPDETDYDFEKYFEYNSISGEIDIKVNISEDDKEKAEVTRRIFGFNQEKKIEDRKRFFRLWHIDPDREQQIDTYNYRFMFD